MTTDVQAPPPPDQPAEGACEDVMEDQRPQDEESPFHEWSLGSIFPHLETDEAPQDVWADHDIAQAGITLDQEGLSGQDPSDPSPTPHKVKQKEFWILAGIDRDSIVEKLHLAGSHEIARKLAECHTQQTVQQCTGCTRIVRFWNRCDLVICPICQPRLSYERKKAVSWWCKEVHQPKHVVLTCRNSEKITRTRIENFKRAIRRLRRRKIARGWRGGFGCLEITNEGRGWHLHCHLLIDADWIDAKGLAIVFGELVGQDFAIVHVSDARKGEYLHQVSKYVVKGNQMSKWCPEDVAAFVTALQGTRTFFTFGGLYKREAAFREVLAQLAANRRQCQCGCQKFKYFSPDEWEWHQIANQPRGPAPTPPDPQLRLATQAT